MKTRRLLWSGLALLVALALGSCNRNEFETTPEALATATPPPAEPTAVTTPDLATVESLQIITLESFPVQVHARVRGNLADGCTTLDETITRHTDHAFEVTLTTAREEGVTCTTALVPFEQTIPLPVLGLEAGTYMVTVNGINGSFTLGVDNVLPDGTVTPTPTPTATAESAGAIHGRVWHDLCAVAGGEGEATATPSAGCVAATDDGSFQANGLMEEGEPGIEGVTVSLGSGECPAVGLATAVTDANGEYIFGSLSADAYCVSVDPLDEANSEILLPGAWTFPADANNATVTLEAGETLTDVNFGVA